MAKGGRVTIETVRSRVTGHWTWEGVARRCDLRPREAVDVHVRQVQNADAPAAVVGRLLYSESVILRTGRLTCGLARGLARRHINQRQQLHVAGATARGSRERRARRRESHLTAEAITTATAVQRLRQRQPRVPAAVEDVRPHAARSAHVAAHSQHRTVRAQSQRAAELLRRADGDVRAHRHPVANTVVVRKDAHAAVVHRAGGASRRDRDHSPRAAHRRRDAEVLPRGAANEVRAEARPLAARDAVHAHAAAFCVRSRRVVGLTERHRRQRRVGREEGVAPVEDVVLVRVQQRAVA